MSIIVIAAAQAPGGVVGGPSGAAETSVTLDTRGANFIFVMYGGGALHGFFDTFVDSLANVWTDLSIGGGYGSLNDSCQFHFVNNPATSAAHTFTVTTPNPGQAHAGIAVLALKLPGTATFTDQAWNKDAYPLDIGPVTCTSGFALTVCEVSGSTETGGSFSTADPTPVSWGTQTNLLVGRGVLFYTPALGICLQEVTIPTALTAEWTWSQQPLVNNGCGGIFCFAVTLPPPALIVQKVTQPSPDPTDQQFDFLATGGLTPASFSLKNGESQELTAPAGTGYGIQELPAPSQWLPPVYAVSTGAPASNITLIDGQTVTVLVTNRMPGGCVLGSFGVDTVSSLPGGCPAAALTEES